MRMEIESLDGGFIFHHLPMRLWTGHILDQPRVPILLLNNTFLSFTPNVPDIHPTLAEMAPHLPPYPHDKMKDLNMLEIINLARSWRERPVRWQTSNS